MTFTQDQWNAKADEWAGFARNDRNYWTRRLTVIYRRVLKYIQSGRSLDIGCGPGVLVCLLTKAGFEAHGLDIAENMIAKTAEILAPFLKNPRERLHHSPDGKLPFKPSRDSFHLITALSVLEYIPDRSGFVHHLNELLAPGGYLILSNTNNRSLFVTLAVGSRILRFWPTKKWYQTIRNLIRTGIWSGGFMDYQKGDRLYNATALDRLANEQGLQVIDGLDFYNFSWLDGNPDRRSRLGQKLARRWGWNHIGVYRKPETNRSI